MFEATHPYSCTLFLSSATPYPDKGSSFHIKPPSPKKKNNNNNKNDDNDDN